MRERTIIHPRLLPYDQFPTLQASGLLEMYGRAMLPRLEQATRVDRVAISKGNWSPEPNNCHENVGQWVEWHPGCEHLCGWLVFDFLEHLGVIDLLSHSVLRTEDGKIIDITPLAPQAQGAPVYPFLPHAGAQRVFEAINEMGVVRLRLLRDGRVGFTTT